MFVANRARPIDGQVDDCWPGSSRSLRLRPPRAGPAAQRDDAHQVGDDHDQSSVSTLIFWSARPIGGSCGPAAGGGGEQDRVWRRVPSIASRLDMDRGSLSAVAKDGEK